MKDLKRTISIAKPSFGNEEIAAVKEVLESGIVASGPRTKAFEKEFAEY
ncbi:MAG: aminotransferase DegT, partial [Candidatus Bathyarchaeum sp.]